jgi:3-hydroxybutyryl-CoA dehydratase
MIVVGKKVEFVRRIEESDLLKFIIISNDRNMFHTDEKYCLENGYKGIVSHGMLLASVASYIPGVLMGLEGAVLISQSFSFIKPAYIGDEIKYIGEILKYEKRFGVVDISLLIINHNNEKIATGLFQMKY